MSKKESARKVLEKLEKDGVDITTIDSSRELKWLLKNSAFERYPVCVKKFIQDEKYLGSERCRQAVLKKMVKIFGDQDYVEKNPKRIVRYEDVADMEGIGSGKSYSASLYILYGVYRLLCLKSPQDYYKKSRDSGIYFMLMSTSQKNARDVIFGEINARITENPKGFLATLYPPKTDIVTQLNFAKHISVIPGNSSEKFFVGYNIFMAVIDECDDHKRTSERDYVVEGYNAIRQRITSRFLNCGGVMMIGSPRSVIGFLMRKYKEAANDDKMLGVHLATWEAMDEDEFCGQKFRAIDPDGAEHWVPIEFKRDYERDPDRFWRDLGARPSYTVEPFVTMQERIPAAINPALATWDGRGTMPTMVGSGKKEYIAHIDLGINKNGNDHCGIALGHVISMKESDEFGGNLVQRPYIQMDFLGRLSATSGKEIQISEVRRILFYLRDLGFEFYRVQFDGWQSKDSQQILEQLGITVKQVSVDKDMFAYEALKDALYDSRLEFGDLRDIDQATGSLEQVLVRELKELQRVDGKRVDHPVDGSKDVSDAVAGVVLGLTEAKPLHKIVGRFNPRYVRDELNILNLNPNAQRDKTRAKRFEIDRQAVPTVVGPKDFWD